MAAVEHFSGAESSSRYSCAEPTEARKVWDTVAGTYADHVGASSHIAARRLVELAFPQQEKGEDSPSSRSKALEFGAGTGALTLALLRAHPDLDLLATDVSPAMQSELLRRADAAFNQGVIAARPTHLRTALVDMANPEPGLAAAATASAGFSHIFSSTALTAVEDSASVVERWVHLLRPGGTLGIVLWEFEAAPCGPMDVWRRTAAVAASEARAAGRPSPCDEEVATTEPVAAYVPKGAWTGITQLRAGMKTIPGLEEVAAELVPVGFDHGADRFMEFWWDSENPVAEDRYRDRSEEDKKVLKETMRRVLRDEYADGTRIPLSAAVGVWKVL